MSKNAIKIKKIELSYSFPTELGEIVEEAIKHQKARNSVAKYGIDFNAQLFGDLCVSMEDPRPGNIDAAVRDYISLVGLPKKTYSNYGFDGIEKSLPFGKKFFPKGILGRIFGASIVHSY